MLFLHKKPDLPQVKSDYTESKHYYLTPSNKRYPSITTILYSKPNEGLQKWREMVGEQVADYIIRQAGKIGTAVHQMVKDTLNNIDPIEKALLPVAHYRSIRPFLANISRVHGTEVNLYSDELEIAGKCDCIAEYKGKLSIIDFKTSRSDKKEEWMTDYFLQATAYGIMWRELTKATVEQIVILVSSESGLMQEIIKDPGEYEGMLRERIEEYYTEH